jgi:hypothetical protein
MKPFPVILFDSTYWQQFLGWLRSCVLAGGFVSEEDLNLVRICDDPGEATEIVQSWCTRHKIVGRKVLTR